jgi:osmotically-inducible protein OsmY
MVKVKSILGLLSLGALGAALFACGGSNESNAQPKRPVGVGDTRAANAKLEQAVKENLDAHARLKDAGLAVKADVTKNEVTLSGAVGSEALREQAVEAAKAAQVGIVVNDRIQVQGRAAESPRSSGQ